MGEWRDYKLETIASFKYGKMPKYERFVESGYPVFLVTASLVSIQSGTVRLAK